MAPTFRNDLGGEIFFLLPPFLPSLLSLISSTPPPFPPSPVHLP